MSEIVHAGLIALYDGLWRGALITGASGAGKSDLALRCLEAGFVLVADDRVELWRSGDALYGRAPDPLTGLIEVRGQGVLPSPWREFVPINLVCVCTPSVKIERMPEKAADILLEIPIPRLEIAPLEASAPAKLRRALMALGTGS
jgi:serine kinase of HPr protein (carbohydrate metabolism regulator)